MADLDSNTPYDDVYRTMYVECDDLILPLLNEIFHKNYTGTEKIIRQGNEHFDHQQGGKEDKRITDSSMKVLSETADSYHMECESTPDRTIIVRMFQYASQLALEDSRIEGNTLHVNFPNAAVLFLRCTRSTPEHMDIHLHTPGGSLVYQILTCRISDYTIQDIFERRLYFFIPFYIFNLEKELEEYDMDGTKRTELQDIYADILKRMEDAVRSGMLTSYSKEIIRDLTNKVVWNLAKKYENVKEGIGDIMGGKVLDLDIIRAKHEGIAEGRSEGEAEERNKIIRKMIAKGINAREISELTDISLEDIHAVEKGII